MNLWPLQREKTLSVVRITQKQQSTPVVSEKDTHTATPIMKFQGFSSNKYHKKVIILFTSIMTSSASPQDSFLWNANELFMFLSPCHQAPEKIFREEPKLVLIWLFHLISSQIQIFPLREIYSSYFLFLDHFHICSLIFT